MVNPFAHKISMRTRLDVIEYDLFLAFTIS
jgi:hypothetical protein